MVVILTLDEFTGYAPEIGALTGGEYLRPLASFALANAHAQLLQQLQKRYHLPASISMLPAQTQNLLKRWVYYLALRELYAMRGISYNRDEPPISEAHHETIMGEIEAYTTGGQVLQGLDPISRVKTAVVSPAQDGGLP